MISMYILTAMTTEQAVASDRHTHIDPEPCVLQSVGTAFLPILVLSLSLSSSHPLHSVIDCHAAKCGAL
jgi:hypothetical protein